MVKTQCWRSSIDAPGSPGAKQFPGGGPAAEEPAGDQPTRDARAERRGEAKQVEHGVEHLLVGQIGAPHGLRGEASIRVHSENEHRFSPGSLLMVGRTPAYSRTLEVEALRMHSGRALVKFSGIEDRSGAESVRGLLVFVETNRVGDLETGAYWEHELVGAEVEDTGGLPLGTVTGVEERLEQDIWQVETGAGNVMLPAARGIVVSVDLNSRRIVVDPPLGLFPDDEQ